MEKKTKKTRVIHACTKAASNYGTAMIHATLLSDGETHDWNAGRLRAGTVRGAFGC